MKQKVCGYILVCIYLKFDIVGLSTIEFLNTIAARIEHFGAGMIIYNDIENKVQDFLSEFTKRQAIEAKLHLREIKVELGKGWNTYRDLVKKDDNQGSASTSKTVEEGESSCNKPKIGTPKGFKKRKVFFKKTTPKSKMLEKLQCSVCNKMYESLKALKRHVKEKHDGLGVGDGIKEIENRITCMICKKKLQRDLMTRHIIQIHGYEKPEKHSLLRGFLTLNDKTWKPLWLFANEPEPPREVLVPVDKEGRIHMYGVTFEKEDLDIGSDDDLNDGAKIEHLDECKDEQLQIESDESIEEDNALKPKDEVFEHEEPIDDSFDNVDELCRTVDEIINQRVLRSKTFRYLPRRENVPAQRNLTDEFYHEESPTDDGKVTVENSTVDVKNANYLNSNKEEGDSDYEPDDSNDGTDTRLHNKAIRRLKRNNINVSVALSELMLNSTIIEDFSKYIEQQKSDTCNEPAKLSTVVKAKGHMFRYQDSFLNYEYSKDPEFNLKRLVSPRANDFLELSDPSEVGGWFESISGDSGRADPGRRREMLKAHVSFRNYLYEKLMKADFGGNPEDLLKREMVLRKLENIKKNIENKKLFQTWNKLETKQKNERQKARKVLSPSNDYNEANCVVKWFESDVAKEEEKACQDIYLQCYEGKGTTIRNFVRFANWGRWTIACEDRNRRSVYSFTNLEFMKRKPKWLPPRNEDDTSLVFERFEKLPQDWDPDAPPHKGAEPTCWVIEVSGDDLKLKEDAQLVLTRRGEEICVQFREMKRECKVPAEPNDPFFVNRRGKPLAKMQRTKGSLLEKFGNVCGFEKATTNSLRRAAETQIQNSPLMKQSVEKLQLHSNAVGLKYYDRSSENVRVSFVNQLSHMESPSKNVTDVPPEVKKRRAEFDVEDKEVVVKEAEKLLNQSKMKRKLPRSRNNKVFPDERELMLKFYSPGINERFNGILPGNCLLFYILSHCLLFRRW